MKLLRTLTLAIAAALMLTGASCPKGTTLEVCGEHKGVSG